MADTTVEELEERARERRERAGRFGGMPKGAGGTPGGVVHFLFGLALAAAGGYLLTSQVTVSSAYQPWGGPFWGSPFFGFVGHNSFGLSLVPLLLGIGMLFFDGKSLAGWILLVLGAVIIVAGILMNLHIYFQPTSLFNTLVMLCLLAAGIGLVARSLAPHPR